MENTLLNLIPAAYLPEIHLSQYDVGRTITFTLKDGASDYSVPSGASVKVKATKPSGFGFEVACTFNGGTVTLVTTDTMTPENGRFPAELSIVSGNTTIGTSNFIFNIERSPHPEGTIDGDAETIIPELTLLVERIEAAADSVDEDTQIVTEAKAEVLQAKADTLQAKADTLSARDESVSAKDLAVSSAQTSVEASERAEELVGSVSTKADAIVKTASGEIASFSDGGDDLPMKSLKVNIVPKQSGSGDPSPSNVRPISGVDTVGVTRAGKNLLPQPLESGAYATANGNPVASSSYIKSKKFYLPAGTYYISTQYCSAITMLMWNGDTYDGHFENYPSRPIFVLAEGRTVAFNFFKSEGITVADEPTVQLELGSTATAYEPYQGTSYPISLGQTVYGGTLDVVSGKLTLTRKTINLGDFSYELDARYSNNQFHRILNDAKHDSTATLLCSQYNPRITSWGQNYNFSIGIASWHLICVDNRYETSSAFRSGVNGVMLCYELATPIEIQLTPTEVKTLLGQNNIWADSGSVEVEYRADTTLAYNELLSLIASLS